MRFENAYIPAKGAWSSPFCKWQGSFATLHMVKFAAGRHGQGPGARGRGCGGPGLARLRLDHPGQARLLRRSLDRRPHRRPADHRCDDQPGVRDVGRRVGHAGAQIDAGGAEATVVITADKCSNGPHLYHPNPAGPGGKGDGEDWVWDNFSFDPWAKNSMIQTAENVAAEAGISREEQDALAQHRYDQYKAGVEAGFQQHYMISPYEVNPSGRKVIKTVEGDEGVFPTTTEGLAKLRPMLPEGTITFGSQTHPADGAAGMLVFSKDRAGDGATKLVSYGVSRVEKGYMAKAVVPAAQKALSEAGISAKDCKVIKTHNPFAVNDIYMARELGIEAESFNNNGSSLIFGHPQGPTGARLIAEGIEEARLAGGGHVLFAGCAAGDTAGGVRPGGRWLAQRTFRVGATPDLRPGRHKEVSPMDPTRILAFALPLVLAACGGGSGQSDPDADADVDQQAPQERLIGVLMFDTRLPADTGVFALALAGPVGRLPVAQVEVGFRARTATYPAVDVTVGGSAFGVFARQMTDGVNETCRIEADDGTGPHIALEGLERNVLVGNRGAGQPDLVGHEVTAVQLETTSLVSVAGITFLQGIVRIVGIPETEYAGERILGVLSHALSNSSIPTPTSAEVSLALDVNGVAVSPVVLADLQDGDVGPQPILRVSDDPDVGVLGDELTDGALTDLAAGIDVLGVVQSLRGATEAQFIAFESRSGDDWAGHEVTGLQFQAFRSTLEEVNLQLTVDIHGVVVIHGRPVE